MAPDRTRSVVKRSPAPTIAPRLRFTEGVRGWAHGVGPQSQIACLEGTLELRVGAQAELEHILAPTLPRPPSPEDHTPAIAALLYWSSAVLNLTRMPVFVSGRQFRVDAAKQQHWLVIPSLPGDAELARSVLVWAARCLFFDMSSESRASSTQTLLNHLSRRRLADKNTLPFLHAARTLGIPALMLGEQYVQYGWGSMQRVLVSSFTDRTSVVSSGAARDKLLANRLLRRAGLPVPEQVYVRTAEAAASAAQDLGFPVVIKPVALDGGEGVAAGLRDEGSVQRAFARAWKLTRRVLVEKHVFGHDYRLMVFQGEVIWAILRHPASVTGDGCLSVRELLAQLNADPRRGNDARARLRVVDLDEEALELLEEQGLGPESIPESGKHVRLRRTANLNRGGIAVAVNEQLHPDNRQLALHAAEALGLDIAGIDVLLPDISRSWRSTGGGICEVNGQPQLGGNLQRHLHAQMLQALVVGQGRIPMFLVVGRSVPWIEALRRALRLQGLRVGLARRAGAWLDDVASEQLGHHESLFSSMSALLAHRRCDVLLAWVEDDHALSTGMAVDRADAIIWFGPIGAADRLTDLQDMWQPPAGTLQLVNGDCASCRTLIGPGSHHTTMSEDPQLPWLERIVDLCRDFRMAQADPRAAPDAAHNSVASARPAPG